VVEIVHMQLRLRTKNGVVSVSIDPKCTVGELYEEIERKTGIEVSHQKSKLQPPPSRLTPYSFVRLPSKRTSRG